MEEYTRGILKAQLNQKHFEKLTFRDKTAKRSNTCKVGYKFIDKD